MPIIIKITERTIEINPRLTEPSLWDFLPRTIPVMPKIGGKNIRDNVAHKIAMRPSILPGCLSGGSAGIIVSL